MGALLIFALGLVLIASGSLPLGLFLCLLALVILAAS